MGNGRDEGILEDTASREICFKQNSFFVFVMLSDSVCIERSERTHTYSGIPELNNNMRFFAVFID
jgi:hypothetical protein